MAKRRLVGTITSVNTSETAQITVHRQKKHRLYGKQYRVSTTFAAHNPDNSFKVGDVVEIEEHRPISKTKHWMIRTRLSTTGPAVDLKEEAIVTEVTAASQDESPTEPVQVETEAV